MKRLFLISMFVSLVLCVTGCTVVKEHYVHRGPVPHAPVSMRTHRRPMPQSRSHPVRHVGPSYRLRNRRDRYVR